MIDRNLKNVIPEKAFRTLEDMDKRMTAMAQEIAVLRANSNGNTLLNPAQLSQVSGLIGARSQAVIGQDVSDPSLPGSLAGGTVTSFSAGDLAPLFTTSEATASTTPALAFAQIVKAKNKVFAGPATGADANPDFRALVTADMPADELHSTMIETTAGAPYANSGYIEVKDVSGTTLKVMTTLG